MISTLSLIGKIKEGQTFKGLLKIIVQFLLILTIFNVFRSGIYGMSYLNK